MSFFYSIHKVTLIDSNRFFHSFEPIDQEFSRSDTPNDTPDELWILGSKLPTLSEYFQIFLKYNYDLNCDHAKVHGIMMYILTVVNTISSGICYYSSYPGLNLFD